MNLVCNSCHSSGWFALVLPLVTSQPLLSHSTLIIFLLLRWMISVIVGNSLTLLSDPGVILSLFPSLFLLPSVLLFSFSSSALLILNLLCSYSPLLSLSPASIFFFPLCAWCYSSCSCLWFLSFCTYAFCFDALMFWFCFVPISFLALKLYIFSSLLSFLAPAALLLLPVFMFLASKQCMISTLSPALSLISFCFVCLCLVLLHTGYTGSEL